MGRGDTFTKAKQRKTLNVFFSRCSGIPYVDVSLIENFLLYSLFFPHEAVARQ